MYDDPCATRADYIRLLNTFRLQRKQVRRMLPALRLMDGDVQMAMRLAMDNAWVDVIDHLQQTRLRFGASVAYGRRWENMCG